MTRFGNLDACFLVDHGYLILPVRLSDEILEEPLRMINKVLSRTGEPKSMEQAMLEDGWFRRKGKLQGKKIYHNLFNQTIIRQFIEDNIIGSVYDVKTCQIALRFKGENCSDGKIPDNWYENWHIDNYTDKDFDVRKRIPSDFTFSLGIYLDDNLEDFSGNFTVFPGAHHRVQSYSRANGGQAHYERCRLNEIKKSLNLQKPYQIKATKGSVIIAHRMLPHLVAPNMSDRTRSVIWYRVTAKTRPVDRVCPEAFMDIWKEWISIRKHIQLKTDHYHPLCGNEIRQIEEAGVGYQVSYDEYHVFLRIRPSISIPCKLASMISIWWGNDWRLHTNGFIARDKNHLIKKTIENDLRDNITLCRVAEWIYNCDYDQMIKRWFPYIKTITDDDKMVTRSFWFDHLHSFSISILPDGPKNKWD